MEEFSCILCDSQIASGVPVRFYERNAEGYVAIGTAPFQDCTVGLCKSHQTEEALKRLSEESGRCAVFYGTGG